MRFFTKPDSFKPTTPIIKTARDFAEQVIGTVNYSDSKQSNKTKVKQDHFISKIGEEAVYAVFNQYTNNLTKPDYTIYEGKNKSWDADIKIDEINLAVKTQSKSSADRYGLSWMFQYGRYRKDTILDKPEAWVCFVQCNDIDCSYDCIVYPPLQIKDIVFGEPKLEKLKNEKKVVYAKDNGLSNYSNF